MSALVDMLMPMELALCMVMEALAMRCMGSFQEEITSSVDIFRGLLKPFS